MAASADHARARAPVSGSFGDRLAQAMLPPPAPAVAPRQDDLRFAPPQATGVAAMAGDSPARWAPAPVREAPVREAPVRRAPSPLPKFRKDEPREIPGFLTAPRAPLTVPALLLMGLLLAPRPAAQAQGAASAPPVAPRPAVNATTAPQPPAGAVLPAPPTPPAPPARSATSAATTAQPARPAAPAARPGNGAQVTPQGAATTRATSALRLDSAAAPSVPRVAADEALLRLLPQVDLKVGGDTPDGGLRLNGTVGVVLMMGLLTTLPTLILMMTGFTRILIVLNFLKQAMGTQTAPPAALVASLALLLTGFVMGPTLSEVNRTALTPWMDGRITQVQMLQEGVKPLRAFMLRQTKEADLATFVSLSRAPRPAAADDVPLHVLTAAFVAGELRTSFQIGFAIYLPFIIIDAVVASVLMSMGMAMLPPAMISLPFKLLLFVLVDGWNLTITSLVQSFK
jgi:flagellar biosynthetic protein FliP